MVDYVKIIADKINTGIPVALYTVGGDTFSVIRALKHRYGVKPVAVCDRDTAKQGRKYSGLDGIPVMSYDDTNAYYPNAGFFISSMDYRYDIMGELVHGNRLPPERIINWEPVEKRESCIFFEKSIFVKDNGDLIFCCAPNSPCMEYISDSKTYANRFKQYRDTLIKSCISRSKLPETCISCGYLCEGWYPIKPKAWWLNWFTRGVCNYKCSYCISPTHTLKDLQNLPTFKNTLLAFLESDMLSDFYSVILSTSGEPTLHPDRKEFFESSNGYALVVNTNGSVFDEDLFALMQDSIVRLIISLDAGSPEKYSEVKGTDSFDKVLSNMRLYMQAKTGYVVPKYIVTPYINDCEAEVDRFAAICIELNVPYVIAAYDQNGQQPIPECSVSAIARLKQKLEKNDILCVPYTPYETFEYVAALKKAFLDTA